MTIIRYTVFFLAYLAVDEFNIYEREKEPILKIITNFLIGTVISLLILTISFTISHFMNALDMTSVHISINFNLLLSSLIICLGVALVEEMIFRGILIKGLGRKIGLLKSYIFSTIVFTLIHIVNVENGENILFFLLSIGVISAFVGALYLYTNSLALVIGFHMIWDFIVEGILWGGESTQRNGLYILNLIDEDKFIMCIRVLLVLLTAVLGSFIILERKKHEKYQEDCNIIKKIV